MRILFAAPGHYMVPTAGGARVVLDVCGAMARQADVTAAFRALPAPADGFEFPCVAIQPDHIPPEGASQSSNAAAGFNPIRWYRYIRTMDGFAARWAGRVDCVVEYGWRGSGLLCRMFRRRGVPAIPAEHFPRSFPAGPARTPRQILRRTALAAVERLAVGNLRRMPLVLAESEALRGDLVTRLGLRPDRVRAAPLGIDTALFFPREPGPCRAQLGLPQDRTIWLYAGGMDMYHDMRPCLQAVAVAGRDDLLVVLLGNGVERGQWERAAGRALGRIVRFVGAVRHEDVPAWIGAADLCLAPYSVERFPRRSVTFSTLKVREYMACGRPVVTVPSGTLRGLTAEGESGFPFENVLAEWRRFAASPPGREQLRAMAPRVLEDAPLRTWAETACDYLAACGEAISAGPIT